MIPNHIVTPPSRFASFRILFEGILRHVRTLWDTPIGYKREAHYMRGPGPKWREKHQQVTAKSDR